MKPDISSKWFTACVICAVLAFVIGISNAENAWQPGWHYFKQGHYEYRARGSHTEIFTGASWKELHY